jgi:peroxiredoxin
MKKYLLVLILLPSLLIAQKKGFIIDGKLDGYADNTEVKLFENGAKTPLATAKIIKSKFLLKGLVAEPVFCMLVVGSEGTPNAARPIELFVENKPISVKGSQSAPADVKIEGSPSHIDFTNFVKEFMLVAQPLNGIAANINSSMPGTERDSMMGVYNSLQKQMQNVIDKQVTGKPTSYVTPFVLTATYSFQEDILKLEERYNKLAPIIKKSKAGKNLSLFIAEKKVGSVGTMAMDFIQPDTTGKPIALSSFKGKYVLLDFWASWCGPCRDENPTVVENYHQFKGKNFTVLGVSLDRPGQKERWLNAIKEDKLAWTQVSDLQFWSNAAAQLYKVQGIPQNFLIDPSGKIVAKNLRGPALRDKLCEVLGCN